MPGEGGDEWESLELTEPKVANGITIVIQFYRYNIPCLSVTITWLQLDGQQSLH